VGDRHILIVLGRDVSRGTNELVRLTQAVLETTGHPALRETTPAFSSLLVRYDPLQTDYGSFARTCLEAALAARRRRAALPGAGERVRYDREGGPAPAGAGTEEVVVPVVYGGEWGPDLEDVARHVGLAPEEVVRRHTAREYYVSMVGFAPGFTYLGGLDPSLETPRLEAPRPRVPAGSVGIAGRQTGIYPADLPGGWRIIGRTPLRLWRPEAADPCLLRPGRLVRFADAGPGAAGWAKALRAAREVEREVDLQGRRSVAGGEEPDRQGRAKMAVAVIRDPGPLTTVQDAGRWGLSALGLPESGPLDWPSFREANLAVGNRPDSAGLETSYAGLKVEFTRPVRVAVSRGARALVGGTPLPCGRAVTVRAGDVLEFGAGASPWNYLALAGGIACPPVLGSRATYAGAGSARAAGRPLAKGDVVEVFASPEAGPRPAVPAGPPLVERLECVTVRAVPGPNDDAFGPAAVEEFFSREWRVETSSDRRACVLGGPAVAAPPATAVSSGTPAGLVQVPPSGRPVVLLADHQTTGGYAAIATVIGPDLPLLARVWPGGRVRFQAVTVEEAHQVWRSMPVDMAGGWPGNRGGAGRGRLVLILGVPDGSRLVAVEPLPEDR